MRIFLQKLDKNWDKQDDINHRYFDVNQIFGCPFPADSIQDIQEEPLFLNLENAITNNRAEATPILLPNKKAEWDLPTAILFLPFWLGTNPQEQLSEWISVNLESKDG